MKWKLSAIWLFGSSLLLTVNVNAQIVPDRSLSTSVTSTDGANFIIDDGELQGNNLFHSFQEFSIPTGGAAIFANDLNVVNIFSRVTGNNISQIDGAIVANGTANLFLINPNGIIFGKNASLDIGGSFFASTASKIVFADGTEFSAIEDGTTTPLLTISTPIGLQLGQNPQPITITTNGNGLTVKDDRTLGLIGGNITLENAILNAPSGRIELASFADGKIALIPQGLGWRLGEIETINGKEIQILAGSSLYSSNSSQNSDNSNIGIQIQSGKVLINDSQVISLASDRSNGGTIDIFASQLTLESSGKIQSSNLGSGKGGAIEIETNKLDITGLLPNSSEISCFCSNASQISSETNGAGNGGNVRVITTELSLSDGGQISSTVDLESMGRGGDLLVNVRDELNVTGINPELDIFPSAIVSYSFGKGKGGDIRFNFNDGIFRDGGSILSLTQGEGKGGDIVANSTGDIFATGVSSRFPFLTSGIISFNLGAGDGGNISLATERLHLENGASVLSLVFVKSNGVTIPDAGTGDGGDVNVAAEKSIDIIGVNPILTNISTNLGSFTIGSGDTGDVTVTTENLRLSEGAQLVTLIAISISTLGEPIVNSGQGNGGNLTVNASESIEIIGVDPFLFTPTIIATVTAGFGDAGDGIVNTRRLIVRDGANIGSLTTVTGDAGKFTIKASESISVSGINRINSTNGNSVYGVVSSINSNALIVNETLRQLFFLPLFPTGNTGELTIETGKLTIFDGGRISVQHQGTGDAGTLTINADSISLENGGSISATTTSGVGGNIRSTSQNLILKGQNSQISATSLGNGDGGNIEIVTDSLAILEGSSIFAKATQGNGGKINITTQGFFSIDDRQIDASSQFGIDGIVSVNSPDISSNLGLLELSVELKKSDERIATSCNNGDDRLQLLGRDNIPVSPIGYLSTSNIWQDLRATEADLKPTIVPAENIDISTIDPYKIVEAEQIVKQTDGRILLLGSKPNRSEDLSQTCRDR